MLKLSRALVLAVCIIATTSLGVASLAVAGPVIPPRPGPNYKLICFKTVPVCTWILKSYSNGDEEDGSKGNPPQKATHTTPVCEFGGAAQACTDSELGNWSNSQQCYMKREYPPPPPSDPRWEGHTDGSIWACTREQGYDQGRHLVTSWVWLPGQPDTVVVDPVTLAYQAIAKMQLAAPLVKSAPGVGQVGLVNMPVWVWVDKTENTWDPSCGMRVCRGCRLRPLRR